MTPTSTNEWQFTGRHESCDSCRAPMVDPIPPTWLATFTGPMNGGVITLHLPTCPQVDAHRAWGAR